MLEKIKAYARKVMRGMADRGHEALEGTAAEAYVDTGVKILIAVVIGALLLAGLYALFDKVIMPNVKDKTTAMFDNIPDAQGYEIGGD